MRHLCTVGRKEESCHSSPNQEETCRITTPIAIAVQNGRKNTVNTNNGVIQMINLPIATMFDKRIGLQAFGKKKNAGIRSCYFSLLLMSGMRLKT